jgi:tetratricopeptide (TPR) repeat protein
LHEEKTSGDWIDRLSPRSFFMLSVLSIMALVAVYFFYKNQAPKPTAQILPAAETKKFDAVPQQMITHITISLSDKYDAAENLRSNNQFDEAIKRCDSITQIDPCYWRALNLKAECLMLKSLNKSDNLPDLEDAVIFARKAISCHPVDHQGFIYSTLAQIYGEMGNDTPFYKYLDSTLSRRIPVWEYLDQPGFNKYRNVPRFKKVVDFAKNH